MKNYIKSLPLAIMILLISCEKDCKICEADSISQKDTTNEELNTIYTLIAGDILSDSIKYIEFDPYISLKGEKIDVDTNFIYNDSIWLDLNNDNVNDIYFEYYRSHFQPSCDSEEIDCCMPIYNAACYIKTIMQLRNKLLTITTKYRYK